jgi:isocitrate dehydrogenase (NAD+)
MARRVTLIPGDWIGPEICHVMQVVIAAAGVDIDWDVRECRGGQLDAGLLESCRRNGVVLKARLDASRVAGRLPPTVALRKELGLWATVRPVRPLPGIDVRFPGIDLIVVRETSEDIYSGLEHEVVEGVYEAVKVTTQASCERIARFAYELARARRRRKVTIVHKANILKQADGLFLRVGQEVGRQFPDITTDEVIVDALSMRLVRDPSRFDVLLTGNLFGDIVSDLASGLAGGIMASPSASYGEGVAMFENPHGKAPELVGTGRANPLPMLLTALLMLEHIGEDLAADRISRAIAGALAAGLRTVERGGPHGLAEVQDAVIARLG